jgi:hypothetical protein
VAWRMKKSEIVRDTPSATRKKFLYNLSRGSYQKEWGREYERPGFRSMLLAFVFRILPRMGKSRDLRFEVPTPAAEKLFMASFNASLDRYRELLSELQVDQLKLPNENFDVGEVTAAGGYRLGDRAYAQLLDKLDGHYADMPSELRLDILAFYGDLSAPVTTKSDSVEWARVIKELDQLKQAGVGIADTRTTP